MQPFLFLHIYYVNHRAEYYTLSKLQPQEASLAEDTDSSMATFVQLEQTSAGHFGRVDSGSNRNTAGHSVCNSGWTSGTGEYTIQAHTYTCDCVLAAYKLPSANDVRIKVTVFQYFSINDNSPKNLLEKSIRKNIITIS